MKKTLFLMAFLTTMIAGTYADSYYDTSSMSAQDQNAPIGWGAGVTGGADQNQVTVTTLSELQSALTGTDQKTIIVDGTIEFTGSVSIDGVQNKSIYGKPGAKLYNSTHSDNKDESGILTLKNCSNIIIRNLIFQGAGAYDIDGNDNLTLQNCSNIWVDHCDFQDGVDGNLDCNNGSDNICVSWCRFRYQITPWAGGSGGSNDHRFSNLWGGDDEKTSDDGKLNTTFVNCWWDEGCRERMPRVRYGKVHILNCLYSSSAANYCVGGGYKSNVYIEKCAFTSTQAQANPWKNCATKDGYTDYNYTITDCIGALDAQERSGSIVYFTPTNDYTYTSYEASSVASVVSNASNGAGATLKLPGSGGGGSTTSKAVLSWYLGLDGADAVAANSITGASGSEAEGFTITISGNAEKKWSNGNGSITYNAKSYKTLKNSNGAQNTVTLPTGMYAHKVDFYAVTNADDADGNLSEFNGSSCTHAVTSRKDYDNPTLISKEFDTGVNSFTFTFNTKQVCFIAIVTYSDSQTLDPEPGPEPAPSSYTNTWQFGKSNGAENFALQMSPEYVYTVNEHSLTINTDAGKLNNASRSDQWSQCNDGTLFKVPTFEGAKLSWGRYNGGSETGFTIGGQLFNEYYIATEEGTTNMTATGISYLSYITVQPVTMYEVTGTITGGDINSKNIIFTANGNGQQYSATVAENAFTLKVPADTYSLTLGGDVAYVVSSPAAVTITESGSIGAVTIVAATPQTVTGQITNAPAEAFTLTFTGANNNKNVEMAAGATSYTTTLTPDTYTISTSVGALSPLSVESFQVVKDAVTHNIYFPEAAVPAATQQNITVDNTLPAASANNYKTVTDALAAAKAGSISSPIITLTSGQTYMEQVIVDQANVTFKTSGAEKATITWYYGIGYSYYSLDANGYYNKDRAMTRNSMKIVNPGRWGATVLVKGSATNFKAENIIFENSFNQRYTPEEVIDGVTATQVGDATITYDRTLTSGQTGYKAADSKAVTERAAAIAFENNPTGVELYNCVFIGSQDTFYTSGKIYVKNCNIQGNTDYIFGGGYVAFDDCDLTIGGYSDQETSAYITAYKDGASLDASKKYVFRDCTVKGSGRTYVKANLGRDWGGAAASVYFFNLKNNIGNKLTYGWSNMGGGVTAGTADLHIYDFDASINSNYYATTGTSGANINGLVSDENALTLYKEVVTRLGFTPAHIYDGNLVLSESSAYNKCRIAASDGATRTVELTRAITAGRWSTIVLPFDIASSNIATIFGASTQVAELSSSNGNTLTFTTTLTGSKMKANQPYAIKVTSNYAGGTFSNVTIEDATPTQTMDDWQFVGSYATGSIPVDGYFFSDNKIYRADDDTNTLKPFRAYFMNSNTDAHELMFTVDGDVTSIRNLTPALSQGEGAWYDLQGRQIVNGKLSNGKLPKGLYIVNGKKVIVK